MDGYQFSASLFQSLVSLAGPAALIVCVWLFRAQLAGLLPNLRVKHKDWEISFRLGEAEKAAAKLPAPTDASQEAPPTPEEKTLVSTNREVIAASRDSRNARHA